MANIQTIELKTFIPAKDFELSKRFYTDLGFTMAWCSDDLAYFYAGPSQFLLQNFYQQTYAENFMMHLLVEDVEAWWEHVGTQQLGTRYEIRTEPPVDREWGIRDFILVDPTGVLWRIGQEIPQKNN